MSKPEALGAVLELLRKIKNTPNLAWNQQAGLTYLQHWSLDSQQSSEHQHSACLRMSLGIVEQAQDARVVIANTNLSDEAKTGIFATLDGVIQAFSIPGLQNAVSAYIPLLDPAITILSVVASAASCEIPQDVIQTTNELIKEIEELQKLANVSDLGDELRSTIDRHLSVLSILLKSAQAVGYEAALSAYVELMVALARGKVRGSDQDKEKAAGFWEKARTWGDRFQTLTTWLENGTKLVGQVKSGIAALTFFGS